MTTIYHDFDNVYNVYDGLHVNKFDVETHDSWGDYQTLAGTRVIFSPTMIMAINTVARENENVWLTTQEHEARVLGAKLGIYDAENWEVLDAIEHDLDMNVWLKFDSLKQHYERNGLTHAIWIDDEHADYPFINEWCERNRVTMITTSALYGLSPDLMRDLLSLVR